MTTEGWLLSANLAAVLVLLVAGVHRTPGAPPAQPPPAPVASEQPGPPAVAPPPVTVDPDDGFPTYAQAWWRIPPGVRGSFPGPRP